MKKLLSIFTFGTLAALSLLHAQSTCGNDGPNDPGCPGGGSPSDSSSTASPCPGSCSAGTGSAPSGSGPKAGVNPIDTYRANLHRHVEDIRTYGAAPVTFFRTYCSRTLDFTDPYWQLGYKQTWQHNWNYEVRQLTTKTYGFFDIKVRYPDGNDYNFKATDATGAQLAPAADNSDRLYRWTGSTVGYTLISPTGREYDFKRYLSPKFALMQVRDGQGFFWNCSYDSTWRLIQIANCFGRYLQINYETGADSVSRIASVQSSDGRTVSYSYSTWATTGNFNLTGVTYPDSTAAAYTYVTSDPSVTNARPLLETALDPKYPGAGAMTKYVYNYNAVFNYGAGPYLVTGTVLEERNKVTDQLIVSLPNGGGPNPTVINADGGTPTRVFSNGLLATEADAVGRPLAYTRDSGGYGFVSTVTEGSGTSSATTSFTRDYAGRILTQTDALNHTQTFTYNAKGFVLTAKDANNQITTYTRDSNGWVTRKDHPDGTYETWTYNSYGEPLTHRRQNGGTELMAYYNTGDTSGTLGDLKTFTDALGKVTTYTYFTSGLTASVKDARNNTTSYTYDWRGNILVKTNPDNSTVQMTYDGFGNKLTQVDELGNTSSWTYDEFNRAITATDRNSFTTSYEYGLNPGCSSCSYNPTITKITTPEGRVTEYTYDLSQKRTSEAKGVGTSDATTTSYSYNNVGDLVTLTDGRGKVWTTGYDLVHRKTSATDPLTHTMSWTYDNAGNRLTETRADTGVTTKTYDSMNRVLTIKDPKNQTTTFTYDAEGAVATLTDAKSNIYSLTYDLRELKTRMTYPGGSHEDWTYDAVGNSDTYTTRAGQVKTITYNTRNWPTAESWTGSGILPPAITRYYDNAGHLTNLINAQENSQYYPDGEGQVYWENTNTLRYSGWINSQIRRYFNGDGLKTQSQTTVYTSPSKSLKLLYTYTGRNQVATIKTNSGTGTPTTTYSYDLNGNRLSRALRNGVTTAYAYDDANRLTSVDHQKGGTSLFKNDYSYNSVNNRTSRSESLNGGSAASDSYGYDAVDQVTSASYSSGRNVGYDYDAVGNRNSVTDTASGVQPASYTANSLNQYTAADALMPTYDGNGNLTSVGSANYQYDAQSRMVYASGTSAFLPDFRYDALNRCVSRGDRSSSGDTLFFYDGWTLMAEMGVGGGVIFNVPGVQADEWIGQMGGSSPNFPSQYNLQDALGSVVAVTDGNGNLLERYTYDIYGTPTIYNASGAMLSVSAYNNRFLFTGREWLGDFGANIYDYRNRMYLPSLGRFLQTDRIGFFGGDVNLVRYVNNSSLDKIDPLGLDWKDVLGSLLDSLLGEKSPSENKTPKLPDPVPPGIHAPPVPGPSSGSCPAPDQSSSNPGDPNQAMLGAGALAGAAALGEFAGDLLPFAPLLAL